MGTKEPVYRMGSINKVEAHGRKATNCSTTRGYNQVVCRVCGTTEILSDWAGNTWNFDETGVRNACPGHMWVWVPVEIKEVGFTL
jgi:hypothetical protein